MYNAAPQLNTHSLKKRPHNYSTLPKRGGVPPSHSYILLSLSHSPTLLSLLLHLTTYFYERFLLQPQEEEEEGEEEEIESEENPSSSSVRAYVCVCVCVCVCM